MHKKTNLAFNTNPPLTSSIRRSLLNCKFYVSGSLKVKLMATESYFSFEGEYMHVCMDGRIIKNSFMSTLFEVDDVSAVCTVPLRCGLCSRFTFQRSHRTFLWGFGTEMRCHSEWSTCSNPVTVSESSQPLSLERS